MSNNHSKEGDQGIPQLHSISNEPTLIDSIHPAEDKLIGMTLDGRYRIEAALGGGGIGKVYLARDKPELLSRTVVVKVLLEESLKNPWVVNKFHHEIEALSRIKDPGVIGIIDAGKLPDGSPYIVMEYVDGVDLRSIMKKDFQQGGAMDPDHIARIIRQICHALDSAHKEGVYHRDLKPENIMVGKSSSGKEQIKVIDFGIAKVTNSLVAPSTVTGISAGTVAYMSPEQLNAKKVTAASDIYSMGVIAYEMVTGRRPFSFKTPPQLAEMQRAGVKVKPKDLRGDLPVKAEQIILKALSYNAQDRPQQVCDFGDQLAEALVLEDEEENVKTLRPFSLSAMWSSRGLRAGLLAALIVLAIGGVAIATWSYYKNRAEPAASSSVPGKDTKSETPPISRTITYSLLLQRYRNGKPYGEPRPLPGDTYFEKDDRVKMFFSGPEQGYFYLLNDGPEKQGVKPNLIMLFPDKDQLALIPANQQTQIPAPSKDPEEDWIGFDEVSGMETMWIVWSPQPIEILEGLKKWADRKDIGEVKDSEQNKSVREFLNKNSSSEIEVKKNDDSAQTTVTGRGDIFIYPVKLKHL